MTFSVRQALLSLMFQGQNDTESTEAACRVLCCCVWLLCSTWEVFVRDFLSHLRRKVLRERARAVVMLMPMLL